MVLELEVHVLSDIPQIEQARMKSSLLRISIALDATNDAVVCEIDPLKQVS